MIDWSKIELSKLICSVCENENCKEHCGNCGEIINTCNCYEEYNQEE